MNTNRKAARNSSLMQIRKGMLWIAVIGAFLIGIRHLFPGEAASGGAFDAFCPFGAIETLWAYLVRGQTLKTTNLFNFAILSGVLAVSLVAGRAFCGWMCPLGAVQEGLAKFSRRLAGEKRHIRGKPSQAQFPLRLPDWADRPMRYAKYLILAVVIFASVFSIYPPLHPLCPARAVFSFKLNTGLMWSVLIIFIITSLLVERVWCKYLCPLGAALAIFNKISPLRLSADFKACNHCGRCDIECSMGIQDVPDNLSDAECIRCLECLETCAREDALTLRVDKH
ncbi:MAG: 4Fe-4S binding protein [Anaerolineales bacterium]|nr:4Fe-4S binding protein [Anaerolineales bacterium]